MRTYDEWGLNVVAIECPECATTHWIPDQLVEMSAGERIAKIEQLWMNGDINDIDYKHWKHVILLYAAHEDWQRQN